MLTILLHSSKTMVPTLASRKVTIPVELERSEQLRAYVTSLSLPKIQQSMHVSAALAKKVKLMHEQWLSVDATSAVVEIFRGDIYSGLRALEFTEDEKDFASKHLYILPGLYGLLRPYDAVKPYRLEAAYRFTKRKFNSIYDYWGDSPAGHIPQSGPIVNLASVEYEKLITPYIDTARIIAPKFLSIMKPGQVPTFVAVHAKVARGAYARWLIRRGRDDALNLEDFSDLGYRFVPELSTEAQPVYVCDEFLGIGLSQRLV